MTAAFVPAHHKPYPELAEPRAHPVPYSIVDTTGKTWLPTNGMTSLVDRRLYVPLQAAGRGIARHELAHVKWSPPRLPPVDYDLGILLAVEDARLNLGLESIGLGLELGEEERAGVGRLARQDLERGNLLAVVLRAIAALGTNAEDAIRHALHDAPADARDLVVRHVRRTRAALLRGRRSRGAPVASFRRVLRLAKELAREVTRELEELGYPPGLPFPFGLAGAGCCLGHGLPGSESAGAAGGADARLGGEAGRRGAGVSGALTIAEPPLDFECPGPRAARRARFRPTAEGSVAGFLHRWPLDGAIFRRAVRGRGGSVLVDVSGSMSLDAAGIDDILRVSSGAARVAIYSGKQQEGELRIVARDGRRAGAEHLVPYGRGNVVDEPALQWLAAQEAPRIWITDGGVTGIDDCTSSELQERCRSLCEQAAIRRARTVQEAVLLLRRRS